MTRILIYLFPILLNYLLGGIFFITAHRFAAAGASPLVTTATMATWGAVYAAGAFIISRFITTRNAAWMIFGSGLGITATSFGFLAVPGLYAQFFWLFCTGVSSAFFTPAFQVFMKDMEPDQSAGVVRSTALYTFSWSCGMATGPFVFGLFSDRTGFLINAAMGLVIAGGVLLAAREKKHPRKTPAGTPVAPREELYADRPDYAWIGWVVGGLGTTTTAVIRTLVPMRAELCGFSRADAGLILAVLNYTQGFAALALIHSKVWMYHWRPAAAVGAAGVVSLLLFGFGTSVGIFYLAALIYACYSGCFYFYLVFHSLVHPTKSAKYIGVNEVVVGATSIGGSLAGGAVANLLGTGAAFAGCAFLSAAAGSLQTLIFARRKRK